MSGNGQELYPQNGRWNFNNKVLLFLVCFSMLLSFIGPENIFLMTIICVETSSTNRNWPLACYKLLSWVWHEKHGSGFDQMCKNERNSKYCLSRSLLYARLYDFTLIISSILHFPVVHGKSHLHIHRESSKYVRTSGDSRGQHAQHDEVAMPSASQVYSLYSSTEEELWHLWLVLSPYFLTCFENKSVKNILTYDDSFAL